MPSGTDFGRRPKTNPIRKAKMERYEAALLAIKDLPVPTCVDEREDVAEFCMKVKMLVLQALEE